MFCSHEAIKARKSFDKRRYGNVFVAFWWGIFLFRRIIFCRLAYLIMYVVFAVVVMHYGRVAVTEITVRHHIRKPNGHRLDKAAGIKQNEVICDQFFQTVILGGVVFSGQQGIVVSLWFFPVNLGKQIKNRSVNLYYRCKILTRLINYEAGCGLVWQKRSDDRHCHQTKQDPTIMLLTVAIFVAV